MPHMQCVSSVQVQQKASNLKRLKSLSLIFDIVEHCLSKKKRILLALKTP